MSRLVSTVLLALAVWAGSSVAAAAAQPLSIDNRTDQLRIDHLDAYSNGEPVTVRVQAQPAQAVTLIGLSPAGTDLRVPLVREPDGSFTGVATLSAPGSWTLAISTTANGVQTLSQSFVVTVADSAATTSSVLTMLGLALVSIGGGVGLIAVGRKNAVAQQAA